MEEDFGIKNRYKNMVALNQAKSFLFSLISKELD
jgi:hypothetical protein